MAQARHGPGKAGAHASAASGQLGRVFSVPSHEQQGRRHGGDMERRGSGLARRRSQGTGTSGQGPRNPVSASPYLAKYGRGGGSTPPMEFVSSDKRERERLGGNRESGEGGEITGLSMAGPILPPTGRRGSGGRGEVRRRRGTRNFGSSEGSSGLHGSCAHGRRGRPDPGPGGPDLGPVGPTMAGRRRLIGGRWR
ncbi:hypothetical protein D1007_54283 [Hordeum vulgare]|nr:hypothetical protein D1007_54283 [Hordeum vulgare]